MLDNLEFIFMKIIFYTFLTALCFAFTNGRAQVDPKIETTRLMDLLNKLEGTYQVQIIDSRELPAIPLSLMDTIEAKRDKDVVKFVWLKSNTRVKILPKTEILSPTFKGLTRVIHLSSYDLK